MQPNSNLAILRELTHQLTLQDFVRKQQAGWVRYDVSNGNCLGLNLLHERTVAVQKSFMSAGTVFPQHTHEEIEILIIFEGRVEVEGTQYGVGGVCYFAPGVVHDVRALEDTWLIGITIPASPAYPQAEQADAET